MVWKCPWGKIWVSMRTRSLLQKELWDCVKECKEVSLRLMQVKMKEGQETLLVFVNLAVRGVKRGKCFGRSWVSVSPILVQGIDT